MKLCVNDQNEFRMEKLGLRARIIELPISAFKNNIFF